MPLATRQLEPELMDDPALDRTQHIRALRGLSRLGHISRVWPTLRPHLDRHCASGKVTSVLEVACGGGDLSIQVARWASRNDRRVDVKATDLSRTGLAFARLRARRAGVDVQFSRRDALEPQAQPQRFDVVLCTLFLHHLRRDDAVSVLRQLASVAQRVLLVDDLCRSWVGLGLCYLGTRTLTCSRIVHVDGPLSVRAAFTPDEMQALARDAGLSGARIERHWPQRQLLIYEPREGRA